ncbi:MAG TPA: DinB family protein [Candidatus Micrarchaeaceae archaeon]|nr:DinB family protein [Candidatus Micrarchaeaceae archaeon]
MRSELDTIRWLWAYHAWARPRLAEVLLRVSEHDLRRSGVVPGGHGTSSVVETLAHLVDAEESWLYRWRGLDEGRAPDPDESIDRDVVIARWEMVEAERSRFLAQLGEDDPALSRPKANLAQAMLHVFNHTTHHRSEICVGLTALGFPPPPLEMMDYIRSEAPA